MNSEYKTICCKAPTFRVGCAHYICLKCKEDRTIELVFWVNAQERAEEIKQGKMPASIWD